MFRLLCIVILFVVVWKISMALKNVAENPEPGDPAKAAAIARENQLKEDIRNAAGIDFNRPK